MPKSPSKGFVEFNIGHSTYVKNVTKLDLFMRVLHGRTSKFVLTCMYL